MTTEAVSKVANELKVDISTSETDRAAMMKRISRSFLSDTLTAPTPEMHAYAVRASLGDDVFSADDTTIAFEKHIAKITGKEAGLFCASGTLSNQLGLRTHLTQPPYSVLCDVRSHIHKYEAGGVAFHSGAAAIPVTPQNGHHLTLADVQENVVLGIDIHTAPTRVIALENTLNGTILPQEDILEIAAFAKAEGIKLHLDGARIWNVAAETGTSIHELCQPFDSVSLCFSKGLGAPIGSVLVGPKEFIAKARWFRKLFGGGMRQTGYMAASAAYALSNNFELLPRTHELARLLEEGLLQLGVEIVSKAETSMVFFDPSPLGIDYPELIDRAAQLPEPIQLYGSRLVVHIQTSPEAITDLLLLIKTMGEEKKKQGFVPQPRQPDAPKSTRFYRAGVNARA